MANERIGSYTVEHALSGWLTRHGVAREDARADIERVNSFYSAYVLGVFHRHVDMGVSAKQHVDRTPHVLLHLVWPSNSQEASIRVKDEGYYQEIFSAEVAEPALPAVSFGLRFCDMGPKDGSPEELIRRLSRENKARYIGILNGRVPMRYVDEVADLLGKALTLAARSGNAISQIHQLTYGFSDKPEAEQHAALKQARGLLAAVRGKV